MNNNIKLGEKIGFYYKNNEELLIVYPVKIDKVYDLLLGTFSKIDIILNSTINFRMYSDIKKIDLEQVYAFDIDLIKEFTDYSSTDAFDKYSKCEGCRYGYSNQMGHMEEGGCLYLNL